MTVWGHPTTIFKQRRVLQLVGLLSLCVALTTTLLFGSISRAAPGINSTINFQGRLQYATGGAVADGHYNIQFKIYEGGSASGGGTLKWTENYVNNNSASGVDVKNGYFSVNLGTNNPFGSQVNWNQDTLYLSMNLAGSADTCTTFGSGSCTADGEMTPMQQLTAVPYAINSGMLGGKTADNFLQLAQGVQTDASTNTSSIYINKTGSGNLLQLQNSGIDAFTLSNSGDLTFGNNANHTLGVTTAGASTAGKSLTVSGGGGGSGTGSAGGDLILQGGVAGGTDGNGGNLSLDAGAKTGSGSDGTIGIGTSYASTINIGSTTQASGTQTVTIGGNSTATTTQNITVGSASGANTNSTTTIQSGGSTVIQSKGDTTVSTNGTQRARFSASGNILYVGNADNTGVATTANSFTIQGTSSSGSNIQGGSVTLQAGAATSGNANGGNITIGGGAGVGTGTKGLVIISTPTFQTAGTQSCSSNCTITQANVDGNGIILVGTTVASLTVSMPDPTNTTAGRIVYVTATNGSNDFALSLNGGGTGNLTSMRQNTTATLIWNGSDWTVAGASNSTTLQSAYDNTLQSAGGAELIVSKSSTTNGLTIRDSATNSVNGTLLQVQSKTAANLFSVNSNVTDYVSDNGAETAGASSSTFPSSTWASTGSAIVTRNTTTNNDSIATGQASVGVVTTTSANSGVSNQLIDPASGSAAALNANTLYSVSFAARLASGSSIFNDMTVLYQYDNNSAHTVTCATGRQVAQTSWTKVNCSFTVPSSGVTSSNLIRIEQAGGGTARTFYIDNLSVTITASQNYSTDSGVDSALGTNWVAVDGSAAQNTTNGYDKSSSAQITTTSSTSSGIKNKLAVSPIASNATTTYLYRASVYVQTQTTALTNFTVQYSYDGTNMTNCVDYNTQAVSTSSTVWTKITCMIQTPTNAPTTPYVFFSQGDTTVRSGTLYIDAFTLTIANSTTPNVQIGSDSRGGPVTLLTLDSAASAPIEADNAALFGSMYYDTTFGKIQCYQATGWGSCGAAPDNIITISPEYTNAVMHGTGVGTMTSDFCSSALAINDGSSGQPTVCGSNQTYNFYKWTSPQASAQSYSIYVTYQLPSTFKSFTSGSTSLQAKTDSSNASVAYQVYKSSGGLTACGSSVSAATGAVAWTAGTATGTADPSTCGFSPGDSIVFKITASSASNANAYIGNLGFTFSNK